MKGGAVANLGIEVQPPQSPGGPGAASAIHGEGDAPQRPRRRLRELSDWGLVSLLFVAPSVALLVWLKLVPLVAGVDDSFRDNAGNWIGFANYREAFHDPIWIGALLNSAKGLALVPLFVFLPLFAAFLLYLKLPGWRYFRSILFLAYLLPASMSGVAFTLFLGYGGPWQTVMSAIHAPAAIAEPLTQPGMSIFAVYAVVFWAWFGLGIVYYLAALSAAPKDLFEAAVLDGAGTWRQFWHVAAVSVRPTIAYWTVVVTAGLVLWLFPFVFSLTNGGPGYASYTPEFYVYQTFTQPNLKGYSSALGIMLFVLAMTLTAAQVRFMYDRASKP